IAFARDGALRRKADGETATVSLLAFHIEVCLMARERVLDDRQPEAGAAGLARAAAIDAVETLGETRQVLGGDADAGVLDAEGGPLGRVAPDDAHFAILRRVANRVRHQVAEGAGEFALRAEEVDRRGARQADAVAAAGERLRVGVQAFEQRSDGNALGSGSRAAR